MNPKPLRKIDLYIGVPICFALTVCSFVLRPFNKIPKKLKPNKILFIKLWGMGSIVLVLPALKRAKKLYPDAKIYFLTFASSKQAVELAGNLVDEIITIRNSSMGAFLADSIKAYLYLFRQKLDVIIDLEFFARFTAILTYLIPSKYKIGFYNHHTEGLYRGELLTHRVFYNHYIHTAASFVGMVDAIGKDLGDVPLVKEEIDTEAFFVDKYPSAEEDSRAVVAKIKAHYPEFEQTDLIYVLNNNTSDLGGDLRKWKPEEFAKLADLILKNNERALVLFTGTSGEKASNQEIIDLTKGRKRVINFGGETNLKELIALYNLSKAVVSVDTGSLHFAALSNTKIVALFSTETPILFGPLTKTVEVVFLGLSCQPCLTVYNGKTPYCRNNVCINSITADQVFKKL